MTNTGVFQDRLVMTTSIPLRKYDAQMCIIFTEANKTWLDEQRSSNPLRIPHPKFDKLACQAQGAGIFAKGEISLRDAYCTYLNATSSATRIFYHTFLNLSRVNLTYLRLYGVPLDLNVGFWYNVYTKTQNRRLT